MAREKEQDEAPTLDAQQMALASMISAGVSEGIVAATSKYGPVKQIPITAYHAKTPSNPLGIPEAQRPQLTRRYFQNGFGLDAESLSDEQRRLLNQLKPGSYVEHLIDVSERYPESGGTTIVDIRYNNASYDQRSELKNKVRNFTEMLQQIVAEQSLVPA